MTNETMTKKEIAVRMAKEYLAVIERLIECRKLLEQAKEKNNKMNIDKFNQKLIEMNNKALTVYMVAELTLGLGENGLWDETLKELKEKPKPSKSIEN